MDYEYLIPESPNIYQALSDANELACIKPIPSATESRRALELAVKHWYATQGLDAPPGLSDCLNSSHFKSNFDQDFLKQCHTVRQVGNAAAHGNDVIHDDFAIKLYEVTVGLVKLLVPIPKIKVEDKDQSIEKPLTPEKGVIPDWDEISRIGIQLTPGHRHLIEIFEKLFPNWSIYVEPHAYGYKPDVIAVNPKIGIFIFEVKDYNLNIYRYNGDRFEVRTKDSKWYSIQCPLSQIKRVNTALFQGVLSSLDYRSCRCVLYCHGSKQEDVVKLFGNRRGSIYLAAEDSLSRVLLDMDFLAEREKLIQLTSQLHAILKPSEHRLSNWAKIELRPKQRAAALTRWDRNYDVNSLVLAEQRDLFGEGTSAAQVDDPSKRWFRRFRAPAGAGKSLVLCSRAASACSHGKKTLVCCFNITLTNYLYEIVSNRTPKGERQNFVCRHFHTLIADLEVALAIRGAKVASRSGSETDNDAPFEPISASRLAEIKKRLTEEVCYDAIYVDEVQDFHENWLELLVSLVRPGGEMVIAADYKQLIYETGMLKSSSANLPFRGRWRQIADVSERLPGVLVPWLNQFARNHELGDDDDLPMVAKQQVIDFGSITRWWNSVSLEDALHRLVRLVQCLLDERSQSLESIAVLVPSRDLGESVEDVLQKSFGVEAVYGIFGDDAWRKKRGMYMGGGKLKVSTVHSFKGWDAETVILLWKSTGFNDSKQSALLYAGLTRAKTNLFVFNLDEKYEKLSDQFPASDEVLGVDNEFKVV